MAVNLNMRFVCDHCGNVDDLHYTHQSGGNGFECHRCKFGTWHGYFSEDKYDEVHHVCTNRVNPYFNEDGSPKFC